VSERKHGQAREGVRERDRGPSRLGPYRVKGVLALAVERVRVRDVLVGAHELLERVEVLHGALVAPEDLRPRIEIESPECAVRAVHRFVPGGFENFGVERDVVRREVALAQAIRLVRADDEPGHFLDDPEEALLERLLCKASNVRSRRTP
jgi:hypothetical protein